MCGSAAVPTMRQNTRAKKFTAACMENWPFAPMKGAVCQPVTPGGGVMPAARKAFSRPSIRSSATPYMICGSGTPVTLADIRKAGIR